MNARGHSQFSRPLPWCWQQKCAVKERRRLILLQDEYMSDPAEREAVNLLEFEAALLAGDPHRCVVQQPQRPQPSANAASLTQLWPRAEQPLQWHPCLTWLENHRHAQRILNYETFRTGEPAMSFLQAVFGHEMLGERVSKANHSTAVIPVLFWEVWDRIPGRSNDCQRSLQIFSAIALVLAAEVLKSLQDTKSEVLSIMLPHAQMRAVPFGFWNCQCKWMVGAISTILARTCASLTTSPWRHMMLSQPILTCWCTT